MVRILFVHPDLGIGGAERLVVDSALALKGRGHDVSFLTNHHDPTHCFQETADGSFPVRVVGDWLPRMIFGRFYAACAYFRMLYAAFYASFVLSRREKFDIIFCDQVSVGIPVLRRAHHRPKVIFYCHYPDQLLSAREGLLKRVYRAPLNYLEEVTLRGADKILVNSKFTLRVFSETFQRLEVVPDVLYPSLNTAYFDDMRRRMAEQGVPEPIFGNIPRNAFVFLDINRFERKKNHAHALFAYKLLAKALPPADFNRTCLVIAGGCDPRVTENVEHFDELRQLMRQLDLQEHVLLLSSPKDDEKFMLLEACKVLLYTPENEHFGIVPLEAMYMARPVVAMNSGGPTETVVHNATGLLCEQDPAHFAYAMLQLFQNDALRERMGEMAHRRVQQRFSFEAFGDRLEAIVESVLQPQDKKRD